MAPYGTLHRVDLVRTDVLEEDMVYIIRVKRISELGTTWAVTSNSDTANVVPSSLIIFTFMIDAIYSSGSSVLTTAILYNILEDGILHGATLLETPIEI
jgi:hypothetical protein